MNTQALLSLILLIALTGCDTIQPTNNNLRARVLGTPQAATTATPQAPAPAAIDYAASVSNAEVYVGYTTPAPVAIDHTASVSNAETNSGLGTATMLFIAFVGGTIAFFLYSCALGVFFSRRGAK